LAGGVGGRRFWGVGGRYAYLSFGGRNGFGEGKANTQSLKFA